VSRTSVGVSGMTKQGNVDTLRPARTAVDDGRDAVAGEDDLLGAAVLGEPSRTGRARHRVLVADHSETIERERRPGAMRIRSTYSREAKTDQPMTPSLRVMSVGLVSRKRRTARSASWRVRS
jgi:hypothetical protein